MDARFAFGTRDLWFSVRKVQRTFARTCAQLLSEQFALGTENR